jgi:hypothetical protein
MEWSHGELSRGEIDLKKKSYHCKGIGRSNWQCEHSFGQDMDKQQSGQTLSE